MIVFDIRRKRAVENLPVVRKTIFQQLAERRQQSTPPEIGPPTNLQGTRIDAEALDRALTTLPNGTIIKTPEEKPGIHPIGMGKIEYARWLGVYVYPKFHKGTKVTLANMPFVPERPPKVWWTVTDIHELHYSVQIDKEARQPKAVGISGYGSTFPIYYPPCLLRILQPEEIKSIDSLRNQESDGRKPEAEGLDGIENSADRSTGESS